MTAAAKALGDSPAFPQSPVLDPNSQVAFGGYYDGAAAGLTKREEFAKAAMASMIQKHGTMPTVISNSNYSDVAIHARLYADALLEALTKETP